MIENEIEMNKNVIKEPPKYVMEIVCKKKNATEWELIGVIDRETNTVKEI